jgi:hypothetical protein
MGMNPFPKRSNYAAPMQDRLSAVFFRACCFLLVAAVKTMSAFSLANTQINARNPASP